MLAFKNLFAGKSKGASEKQDAASEHIDNMTLPLALEDGAIPGLLKNVVAVSTVLFALAIIWISLGQVSELAIANGQIVPSGLVKNVRHLEGGIVEDVLVKEGQLVEEGTILLRLRPEVAESNLKTHILRSAQIEMKLVRLHALITNKDPDFSELADRYPEFADEQMHFFRSQKSLIETERETLNARLEAAHVESQSLVSEGQSLERRVANHQEQVQLLNGLYDKKLATLRQRLDAKSSYETALSDSISINGRILSARKKALEVRHQLKAFDAKTIQDFVEERSRLVLELAELKEKIKRHDDQVKRLEIRSPARGIVQQLGHNTAGDVVNPGALVVTVVPIDVEVVAEVHLAPRDVAHVKKGDHASLKVSSFDPGIYGSLTGKVQQISATTLQPDDALPYYRVVIKMDKNYLGNDPLRHRITPGMELTAHVVTGSKSVLQYLLKPVYQSLDTAFSER